MAFFQKQVTLTYETPALSTNNAKTVRRVADAYLRTALTKLSPLVKVLKTAYVSTQPGAITIKNKHYVTYDVVYTFDVEAPATDLAKQAITGALDLPSRKKRDDVFVLLDRKVA